MKWRELKAGLLCIMISMVFIMGMDRLGMDATASQPESEELLKALGNDINPLGYWKDDFDGDGTEELFAITGEPDGEQEVWFSGAQWKGKVYGDGLIAYFEGAKPVCSVGKKQKIFVMEFGAHGSGSISKCFYVEKGVPKAVNQNLEGLVQLKGKDFAIHPSAFDGMFDGSSWVGHTWKRYYLKWKGKRFSEYKGAKIREEELGAYKNGGRILKNIRKEGYQIDEIYKRKNGIININVEESSEGSVGYDNVTLLVVGDKLKVQKGPWPENIGVVHSSSYGGVYKESYLDEWK